MSNAAYILQTAMKYGVRIDFKDGIVQWGQLNKKIVINFFNTEDLLDLANTLRIVVEEIEDYLGSI